MLALMKMFNVSFKENPVGSNTLPVVSCDVHFRYSDNAFMWIA